MNTYIVLLRGINVSGKNKLPMNDLKELLIQLQFSNIVTYIQSGNIVLSSEETPSQIAKKITQNIKDTFEYDVPVLVKTINEWKEIISKNPFNDCNEAALYYTFLDNEPQATAIETPLTNDQFFIDKNCVYIFCPSGYGKTKLTNNFFENKLQAKATTRNYKTVQKLLILAQENNY